jgi:tyrocidine synthetase-3
LGRNDRQVKIRGFRIEPDEIAANLCRHPAVRDAAVKEVAAGNGNNWLCAFVTNAKPVDSNELGDFLRAVLPLYMIPDQFVFLDKLPLTGGGKIDYRALTPPQSRRDVQAPPEGVFERKLAKIWAGVLGIDLADVGRDQDFFQQGGHSLKAVVLINRVFRDFGARLSLRELFSAPTIRGLGAKIRDMSADGYLMISPVEKREYHILAPAQRRLFVLQQIERDSTNYNMPYVIPLGGEMELDRIASVFGRLIQRHESLRTRFVILNQEPVQQIVDTVEFTIPQYDLPAGQWPPWLPASQRNWGENENPPVDRLLKYFVRPFQLGAAPLIRVDCICMGTSARLLLIDMHHIITDGTSQVLLRQEFLTLYEGDDLDPLRLQYRDYAHWVAEDLRAGVFDEQANYWMNQFIGEIPVLELPLDAPRPSVQSFDGKRVRFTLNQTETATVRRLADTNGATLFMVLTAVVNIFLSRLSGQEDIVLGTPVAARRHPDLESIIGMFVNTLALRNYPAGEKTFRGFLAEVRERALSAFENQEYPFEELVDRLKITRDVGRNPLLDVMLNLTNQKELAAGGVENSGDIEFIHRDSVVKFDMEITAMEAVNRIRCSINYSSILFQPETVNRFICVFKRIVAAIGENDEIFLRDIDVMDLHEKRRVLTEFNDSSAELPAHLSIWRLFEPVADQAPDRVAMKDRTSQVTYRYFKESALGLADRLLSCGVGSGAIVGLTLPRSIEYVAAIFGILAAGAAYLPLGNNLPEERMRILLKDSGAVLLEEILPAFTLDILNDDSQWNTVSPASVGGESLAYVIYTSGTSGTPKGVMVEQRAVANLLLAMGEYCPVSRSSVLLFKTPAVFDVAVSEYFGWMAGGSLVVLEDGEEKDGRLLLEVIERCGITHVNFVPSLFSAFLQNLNPLNIRRLVSVCFLVLAGESLPEDVVSRFQALDTGISLFNFYGPTEATVYSSFFPLREWDGTGAVPIGKPVRNLRLYVLDRHGRPVPIGVSGELYIGGIGVGRGYLNRPELTAERFVTGALDTGEVLYRSGDLACWQPDGNMRFLGRLDSQVKLRGYRIELGEIENRLRAIDGVRDAVVVLRHDKGGDSCLCGYVEAPEELDIDAVGGNLSQYLPGYMIPQYLTRMDAFPHTASGKIDRRSLPAPEFAYTATDAPLAGAVEKKVASIWSGVLGVPEESVGANGDFFKLGGHSLKATVMLARIFQEFGVSIPLSSVFRDPTVRGLATAVGGAAVEEYAGIQPVEKRGYYPLSPAQKRLFILQQVENAAVNYNMPYAVPVYGELDVAGINAIFAKLAQRHESLRTRFFIHQEEPVQQVLDTVDVHVPYFDVLAGRSPSWLPASVAETLEFNDRSVDILLKHFVRPFDLGEAPLMRMELLNIGGSAPLLLLDMHHIITDGVSQVVLREEFEELSQARELMPMKLHYRDYACWLLEERQQADYKRQEIYWLERFDGEIPVLDLPLDRPRPATQSFEGKRVRFSLNETETAILKQLAEANGATLFMVLLSLLYFLLAKLSGQEDIVIGTPVAARRQADLQRIVGMFVNTLALRNHPLEGKPVRDFIREVRDRTLADFEHQEYPFEELVEKLPISRDAGRNPLFDVMFNFLNQNEGGAEMAEAGEDFELEHRSGVAKFDITMAVMEVGNRLSCAVQYSSRLFHQATIDRFIEYFKRLIPVFSEGSGVCIGDLEIIGPEEKQVILTEFNDTGSPFPHEVTIHRLFRRNSAGFRDRNAIVFEDQVMTYGQLDNMAGKLAGLLVSRGYGREMTVGVMMSKSLEMIVALLGILKAGCAYLPINSEYPDHRIHHILNDSATGILLVDQPVAIGLDCDVMTVDGMLPAPSETVEPPAGGHGGSLAYVMYTSGTTGQPKGVMVEHRSVLRLVLNANYLQFRDNLTILQTGALEFDASTFEIWGALLNGGQLVLASKTKILGPYELERVIRRHAINTMWMTAPLFNHMVEENVNVFAGLSHLLVGGDVLSPRHIRKVQGLFETITVINCYGPTENTTFSTTWQFPKDGWETIPIGAPISNSTVFVLDRYLRLQPVGVNGELYVGGEGVARGYLNAPALTNERFVLNPFGDGTLYRTGDIGRFRDDGAIDFLGRADQQVKIRGFRVGLEEIEHALLEIPEVGEAIVLARHENEAGTTKYLAAWVVAEEGVEERVLQDHLASRLPAYMIPSYFMFLDELPLTANGKVNRWALPNPESMFVDCNYASPSDDLERELVHLWAGVLSLPPENIGVSDDFFRLGGHSLKATLMAARAHRRFNVPVPLGEVFRDPTIRGLSAYIRSRSAAVESMILPAEAREYYPLSPAQKRMFILQQVEIESIGYNMPYVISLPGEMEAAAVESAFIKLIRRHESLRTRFVMRRDEPVQQVVEALEFKIPIYDLSAGQRPSWWPEGVSAEGEERPLDLLLKYFVRPFDLSDAPLMRVELLLAGDSTRFLLLDMHHIISDGMSQTLLRREFMKLYEGAVLEPLTLRYRDYAVWLAQEGQRASLKRQEAFWLERFPGEIPVLDVPTDMPRPAVQSFEGRSVRFLLNQRETALLRTLAEDCGATLFMVLLALLNVLLSKLSGQEDIVIGTPVAGRCHADLEGIIGMFVNTLALRNFPSGEKTLEEFVGEAKERTLAAFENQEYPFEELVDRLPVSRDAGRNPLFDVMLNLLNQQEIVGELAGPGNRDDSIHRDSVAKVDLSFTAVEVDNRLVCTLGYSSRLFQAATVDRIVGYWKRIIAHAENDKLNCIRDIELMGDDEKDRILTHFNDTSADFPSGLTVWQLFERAMESSPDRRAMVFGSSQISYRYFQQWTRAIAGMLFSHGVRTGTLVALAVPRSIECVAAIFGILGAGAAYLPLGTHFPEERNRVILDDSGARLLREVCPSLRLDSLDCQNNSVIEAGVDCTCESSAYVLYTSGSTGTPKGVVIQHRAVVNLLTAMGRYCPVTHSSVWLFKTPVVFDVAVSEYFGWMAGGSLAVLPDGAEKDGSLLLEAIQRFGITHINFVPSLFSAFLQYLDPLTVRRLASVRYLFLAGETLPVDLVDQFQSLGTGITLFNLYGPTETTVYSSLYPIEERAGTAPIPIGKPLDNLRLYILDHWLRPVPVGVRGELYIGGAGEGLGYLNRPELTADSFVPNPFNRDETLYRSGDLACWLADGNLSFVGRMDGQVKVRGNRIELGEIENRLRSMEGVGNAVVIPRNDDEGDLFLCGYIESREQLDLAAVREYLSRFLPDYMIPAFFVVMDALPHTAGGKLDRQSLPAPEVERGPAFMPAEGELEQTVAAIWSSVLGIPGESIGANSDFFKLGGHSLKATVMLARVYREFAVQIPLSSVFRDSTVRGLARHIETSAVKGYDEIHAAEKREYYPLSPAQKRLFILQQMESGGVGYNMPYVIPVSSDLDIARVEAAFKELTERHDSLRTRFFVHAGEPVQQVLDTMEFEVASYDFAAGQWPPWLPLDAHEAGDRSSLSLDGLLKYFVRPFDLSDAPLIRVELLLAGNSTSLMLVDMHHIITDGASQVLLRQEFMKLYEGEDLEPLGLRYRDYAVWLAEEERMSSIEGQEGHWLDRFAGEIPVLELPLDKPRPLVQSFEGKSAGFLLDEAETAGIRALAGDCGATLFMVLLALLNVLLSKLSGQEDIVIGVPIAARRHADLQGIIGMFVNTLALRHFPAGEKTLAEFVTEVKGRTLADFENQEYPFEELVDKLSLARDTGRNPLFDVMLNVLNQQSSDREVRPVDPGGKTVHRESVAQFDLIFTVSEMKDSLSLSVSYQRTLFKYGSIERFVRYFRHIVKHYLNDPGIEIGGVQLLDNRERRMVLEEFNRTAMRFPECENLIAAFEVQVERTSDSVALVSAGGQVTYGHLATLVRYTALRLLAMGVLPGGIVALLADRSIEMVVGMLGILKAGGAYLPMDVSSPVERMGFVLKDSRSPVLLCERRLLCQELLQQVKNCAPATCFIENVTGEPVVDNDCFPTVSAVDPAYVIYTSGTTGRPKGVVVEHCNVINTVAAYFDRFRLSAGSRLLLLADVCFDSSVDQIFGCLLSGASLALADRELLQNMGMIRQLLWKERITLLDFVPSYLGELLGEIVKPRCLETVVCGAEALDPVTMAKLTEKDYRVFNIYGPSETTVDALCWECDGGIVRIGAPVANTRCYILDRYLNPCPVGVAGELYIAGDGVSRGYLNRPELTGERFTPDPFHPGMMYRTGDRGRWLDDGTVEFIGRMDFQLKIRGFRVEPGEIERQLMVYPAVRRAVVMPEAGGNEAELCAWVAIDDSGKEDMLKEFLSRRLPEYMIPRRFVLLRELPLTPGGKVDRGALPLPQAGPRETIVSPRDDVQLRLVRIWSEVLGIEEENIGIDSDFFALGGHSLKATVMALRVAETFAVTLPLAEIFKTPFIRSLGHCIQQRRLEVCTQLPTDQLLVPLKSGDSSNDPLFFFHDGSGEVESYLGLSSGIVDGVPCWGVRAPRLEGLAPLDWRMEELAARYISAMKDIQPTGPYRLCGFSLGGAVAMAVARRLEAKGETVSCLGLIDAPGPERYGFREIPPFSMDGELEFLASYLSSDAIHSLAERADSLQRLWQLVEFDLGQIDSEHLKRNLHGVLREFGLDLARRIKELSVRELAVYLNAGRSLSRARRGFKPDGMVCCSALFFSASDSKGRYIEEWQPYLAGSIEEFVIPGDHWAMLASPAIETIVTELNVRLKTD